MFERTVLTKSIYMDAKEIAPTIVRSLVRNIRHRYEKTCDEENGVILLIHSIDHIENMISKDARYVQFTVTLTADTFLPEKEKVVEFQPTLILQKGVFGKIHHAINVFIPESFMKGWTFQTDRFLHPEKEAITREATIKAVITDTKFAVTKYNCICRLL